MTEASLSLEPWTPTQEQATCQSCGKCCTRYWIWTDNADEALRFSWLDTDKIRVEEIEPGKWWKIWFDIPCKQLVQENGRYSCKQYGKLRPSFCETYPRNVLHSEKDLKVMAKEREFCPLLDHLAVER